MKSNGNLIRNDRVMDDISRPMGQGAMTTIVTAPAIANPYLGSEAEEDLQFRKYWRAVRKRLWLVVSIAAVITMLTAIYMARKPDIFQAQARVQIDLENTSGVSSKTSSIVVSSPVNDPAYFNTQLQILSSPALLRRVVKTLDLQNDRAFVQPRGSQQSSTWQNLRRMFGFGAAKPDAAGEQLSSPEEDVLVGDIAPETSRDDLTEAKKLDPYVGALQGGLGITPVRENRTGYNKETRLIDISYRHQDPQVAAKIVNAVADTFETANRERRLKNNNVTGSFLQERIAQLQNQIRSGEEKKLAFARNKGFLDLKEGQDVVVERLTGLNQQLLTAENARKLAEAKYNAAKTNGAATSIAEGTKGSGEAIETQLTALRQKRAELLTRYTEQYPAVAAVDAQIKSLERDRQQTTARVVNVVLDNLGTEYRQALAFEQKLRADYNQQIARTGSQNEAAIQYRIIEQEIETNNSLLASLLQSDRENAVVLAGTPNNVSVADYALVENYPVEPRRMRAVIMAFLFSIGLGIGISIFMEFMDDTLHSAEDVETSLRLPAVAVIPQIGGANRRRLQQPAANALQTRNGNVTAKNAGLLINTDTRSPIAEAYRQLRTSVLLSTAGHPPKSLLVTSSFPSEGKTTTAINIALTLSHTGARVLIIDADMRRPRLHSVFGLNNNNGLSTLLSSELTEETVLSVISQSEEAGSLNMLTAGRVPPNPAELLGSEQMRRLLALLETHFDHVIIDSPPIASFTDGVLIASIVDGVLLVVHSGKSARGVAKRSRQILSDVGAKVIGVVLNRAVLRSHDYYYYHNYYNSYYGNTADAENEEQEQKESASTTSAGV